MDEVVQGAVDLHCHLLPGIDDGAPDWETTLAMARRAAADGIAAIVATPHWPMDGQTPGPKVRELAAEAAGRIAAAGVRLRVFPGHELEIGGDLEQALATGDALPLADSRFLLLEMPYHEMPPFLRDLVFRLQGRGYRPILAHPERNPTVQRHPERLEELVDAGCLLQVNAGSVLGHFGPRPRRAVETLLGRGWVQLMASDAHSATLRPPVLSEAARVAARRVGPEAAQALIGTGPFSIVQDLMPPAVRAPRSRGWLPSLLERARGR